MNVEERKAVIKYLFSLLRPVQKQMSRAVLSNKLSRKHVIHSSRRIGKTFELVVLSCMTAYAKSNAHVRYASVTQKAVKKMVHPIFKEIFVKVKKQYRPEWNHNEGAYMFPTESMVHVAGVNNGHADDLRGTAADLCVVDEAAFIDDLSYLVDSVLVPQLLTTNGSLIMASSSPVSPAHEFCEYIHEAKLTGHYSNFTIHDSGYSQETIDEFCKEAGGVNSTTWRREYLNEIIVDDDYAIIPESKNLIVVNAFPHASKFYHKYDSMDIGVKDLTVVLFGHYDFKRAKICIEREFIINGPQMTTPVVADNVKRIEAELWGGLEPYRRISDNNNLLLLQDLGFLHNCHFIPTSKDSLEAMVNEVRIWVGSGRVEIHESCQLLIESIKFGYWNEQRSDFGRSKTLGHFDALAALMYLIRNVDVTTNPVPTKVLFDEFAVGEQELNNQTFNNLRMLR